MALLKPETASEQFRALVDRMFDEFPFISEWTAPRLAAFTGTPAFDVYEKDGKYMLECAVPGYDSKEITVEVSGSTVTITGSHKETQDKKDVKYHTREIRYGSFTRTFVLPQDVNSETVDASIEKGVLKLTLTPVTPIAAKKIEIKAKS